MTTLKRTFNLETRTLKSTDKCYVGQVYDHISTTLEFSYNPINALTDGGYTAYIVFDLCDDNGDLFVFGPGSSPRFDGRTFEIPTSVTSRIKTQRLDYQLWLIKNRLEWNGRIDELGDTEYLFSAKDTLAFKPTSRCRCPTKDPCRPPQPNLEPGTLGWVNYLRDHCILTPIQESYGTLSDGSEGVTLNFPTYNENKDQALELHIPYLDAESKLDIHTFLRIVEEYNPDVTHDQIMTALCVQNLLDEKLDIGLIVDSHDTPWDEYKDTVGPLSARLARRNPVGPWDPEIEYTEDSLVIHEGILFISQGTFNIGHEPTLWHFEGEQTEDFEWWVPIRGRSEVDPAPPGTKDVSTYIEIVGPDEYEGLDEATGLYAYRVYHHFNTSDLYIQARTNGSDREDGKSYTVNAIYDVSDHNSVRVLLSYMLDDDDIVVYISPGGGIEGEYSKQTYQALTYKDQPEGYAGLDRNAKIPSSKLYIAEDAGSDEDDSYLVSLGAIRGFKDQLDDKTDKSMAIPIWEPEKEYHVGSTVIYAVSDSIEESGTAPYGGTLFISLIEGNQGNPPILETEEGMVYSEFWSMVKGESGQETSPTSYAVSFTIGNGSDTTFALSHDLGTKEVQVVTRDRTTGRIVYPEYKVQGFTTVIVRFTEPPEPNRYTVSVTAMVDRRPSEPMYMTFTDQDVWTFTHNKNHIPMVQTYNMANQEILGQVVFDSDARKVVVSFKHAQSGTMVIR